MTADHPTREERYAAVLAEHRLDPRPGITPGGNPICTCGWIGLGHRRHVAATLVAADPAPEVEMVARLEATAAILGGYDCTEDYVPPGVDVPDDYERGVLDAVNSFRFVLGRPDTAGGDA